ncbi:MAG: hypothetical protein HY961_12855 [Ignavibacteriae bacterium]|nr:hypothetical protein [Ignavibacteriota bacterium]
MTEQIVDVETIKSRLHEAVENIDDVEFLRSIELTIRMKYIPSGEVVVLTDAQKQALDKSYEQFKRGEFLTEEQANGMTEQWLRK